MKKFNVLVTWKLPERALKQLREKADLEINPDDRALKKEDLIEGVKGKDALLCTPTDKIDAEVIEAGGRLRVISNLSVSSENVDLQEATNRGIAVTSTPGFLTETTADFTWALILAVARRLVEGDKFLRADKWRGWKMWGWAPMLFLGVDVCRKTLGIIGLGRIGTAVARRSKGFDMKVIYHDPKRKQGLEKELGLEYVDLDELLMRSDFVSLHLPLLPETRHLIGERELNIMKPTSYLINTAKGPVVDELALVKALRERKIAGAALDVFENEPEVKEGLIGLKNVVLAPHMGGSSVEAETNMAIMAVENLLAVLDGKVPKNIVNAEVIERLGLKISDK